MTTPPPAVLAPSVALERIENELRGPKLLFDSDRLRLADELATLRAGLAAHALDTTAVVTHEQAHPAAVDEAMVERFCTAAELAMGIESGFYEKMPVREGLLAVFAALLPATSEGDTP